MRRRRTTAPVILALALLALAVAAGCGGGQAKASRWHCPMHPTYVSDRPGDCPICGMRLVPITDDKASPPAPSPTKAAPADSVSGLASVAPGAEGLRLAGVQTAPAVRERLARTIRAVAQVKADDRRVTRFQARVGGWVERLFVNFAGQSVRAGDPVLSVYSPELLALQQEYLSARGTAARFAGSALPEVRRGGEDLVAATRRRLQLLGVPDDFVATLERTGEPQRAVTLVALSSGFVTAKEVLAGQRIEPGMELFTVTDLSAIWVEAAVYEAEASLVSVGQSASLRLPYDPALRLEGRVAFIYPELDAATRTVRVRLDVPNPGLRLKPGMFADVILQVDLGEQVVVPDDAVMDTGERQYVFVADDDGTLTPRVVTVGWRGDGRAQVLAGLAPGEKVAVKANFLLDSESRLRAAIAGATAPGAGGGQ